MRSTPSRPEPTALAAGQRVVVRHLLADGSATDALGELVAIDPASLTVATRSGDVVVPRDRIVAAKRVPPRPARPGPAHLVVDIDDLQRLMVDGMPPLHWATLGDWLLRSSEGFTGRANSVLAVGDPDSSAPAALDAAAGWYAELGRPVLIQSSGPVGFDPADTPAGMAAAERGWRFFQRTLVMTAACGQVAVAAGGTELLIDATPRLDERWWSVASARSRRHRDTVERLVAQISNAAYLTAWRDDVAVGAARVAFSPGWAGVFDVHVPVEHRRTGVARALMVAAARGAVGRGARSAYLQVSADNAGAIALYESLGFTTHHEYWYARPEAAA